MRFLLLTTSLCFLLLMQTPGQACRLFRGGCSDPCASGACGQQTRSCVGCGSVRHGNVGHRSAYVVSGYQPHVHSHSGACQTCGMTATTSFVPQMQASGYSVSSTDVAVAPQLAASGQAAVDCGAVTSYQVVLQPEYFTETRPQAVTEYRDETRYRTRTIARQVPVEVQDYRTRTVMVPKTESKTVEYQVVVPKTGEKTVEVVDTVPVWNEVAEKYTVRVPEVVDVSEEYTVQVAKLHDQVFNYTVYVPQVQREQKTQRVTNVVPVTKSRTIQVNRPVTRMKQQSKDYGHWEVRVESAPQPAAASCDVIHSASYGCGSAIQMGGCGSSASTCSSCGGCGSTVMSTCYGYARISCGSCGGCGISSCCAANTCGGGRGLAGGCGSQMQSTTSRQVWVPNVVIESVAVTENVLENQVINYTAFEQHVEEVPYECTYMVYAPEQRSGTRQVVQYVPETRTRVRKVVKYNEEERTRMRKELSYEQRTKSQTIPFVKYVTENRTKEVSYTVNIPETKVEPFTRTKYETVQEELSEAYTVRVPVTVYKDVQVQVSRMVPKLVPVTIYPCSGNMSGQSTVHGGGCTNCLPATSPAAPSAGCPSCGNVAAPCQSCR